MIKAGRDFDAGETVLLPIPNDANHYVIGGSSKGGKSQFAQTLLVQLAPLDHTAIVVSDPAWMDYEPWESRLSCLALGRVGAGWLLNQLEVELEWRLRYGRKQKVKQLAATTATPQIVAVFDEIAMVTMGGVKNAQNRLIDIAQVGRKAGIGLVIMTQSPKATVVPRLVMEQCPIRVAFRTEEAEQTDAILGTQRVKAHDIYKNPGEAYVRTHEGDFVHVKTPLCDEELCRRVAVETAHLTPVLPVERGWMPLYDPYEQGDEDE